MSRPRPLLATVAAAMAAVLLEAQGTPPAAPLTLLSREGRRPVPTVTQSGHEFVALDDVAGLFGVTVREDALAGGVTVSYRGRTVVASAEQPMASVNGRLVALPTPAMRSGQRWYVPVEFLSRALGPILDNRIEVRRPSRLVIVGDLRVPRITARFDAVGTPTRLLIDASPAVEFTSVQEPGRIVVRGAADALDIRLPIPGAGLIDQVRAGDQPASLVVEFKNAGPANVATGPIEGGSRVTIEVLPAATAAAPAPAVPAPSEGPPPIGPRPTLEAVVVDPGHGGEDNGVRARDGTLEKTVTLDVARRVKTLIEGRLGIRVILTREDDRAMPLDQRASLANNSKADLFVSLHANGSFTPGVSGAEVFYLATDAEMENALRAAESEAATLPVLGGGTRTIDVVRWDMAQARHLDASAALAGMIEGELRTRVPMGPQPLQRAPLRVLVGANMPAVLVEMAYLTNAAQAKQAASVEFQTAVAQAVYEAVLRYRAGIEATR